MSPCKKKIFNVDFVSSPLFISHGPDGGLVMLMVVFVLTVVVGVLALCHGGSGAHGQCCGAGSFLTGSRVAT